MGAEKGSIAWQDIDAALSATEGIESYLHRTTGDVVMPATDPFIEEGERDRVRGDPAFILIPREESRLAYGDLVAFAEAVDDDDVRAKLDVALAGRGAFARFRDVLRDDPDLRRSFEEYRRTARLGRVRRWLEEQGIELELVVPPPSESHAGLSLGARTKENQPGLVELLMLGGKAEYIGGAVRRHLYCESAEQARAAFKRIAREIVEAEGLGWRKRYVEGTSELRIGRFHLAHDGRHVELRVETALQVYLAFTE
jgi:hypothetical protein